MKTYAVVILDNGYNYYASIINQEDASRIKSYVEIYENLTLKDAKRMASDYIH